MHARTQIRKAFVAALETITDVSVFDGRVFPMYDDVLPAITCFSREEGISDEAGRKIKQQHRTLLVSCQIYEKVDQDLDDTLDDISESIEQVIFQDETIVNMVRCLDLVTNDTEVNIEGEKEIGTLTLVFSCRYLTKDGVPETILK